MRAGSTFSNSRRHQKGAATLLIAILILVILTVVVAFAANVGVFEQRSVGNETRARIVGQVADAGLNHGIEVLKANAALLTLPDPSGGWGGRWTKCDGAMLQLFPCLSEPDAARRLTLYFYNDINATNPGLNSTNLVGAGSRVTGSASINTGIGGGSAVGAFITDYRVGALLCLIAPEVAANPASAKICAPYEDNFAGLVSVTLVSRASLQDDPQAFADVKATIASYRSLPNTPNVPILASGNVNISGGTADIVPNPNAGGAGVALSIWAGSDLSLAAGSSGGSGAVKSCHLGEFLSNTQGPKVPVLFDGMTRCDDCRCDGLVPGKGLLSGKYTAAGSGVGHDKNYDILDKSGTPGVVPPNTYFPDAATGLDDPDNCFDDNLFEYIFGIDTQTTGSCPPAVPGAAELFLTEAATPTVCSSLTSASSGLLWSGPGCSLPGADVGTPSAPVFLVADCDVDLKSNTVFFGVIFIRKTPACSTIDVKTAGSPTLYGSLVAEGNVDIKGSGKFIYSEKVMQAIITSPAFNRFGIVPGSWTDIVNAGE